MAAAWIQMPWGAMCASHCSCRLAPASALPPRHQIVGVIICGQPSINVVAVGDVVFGRTLDGRAVAPAGRMSQMTYPADYVVRREKNRRGGSAACEQ